MSKNYFVVFKRQEGERTNKYSIVNDFALEQIKKQEIAEVIKEVEAKDIYTPEDIEGYITQISITENRKRKGASLLRVEVMPEA